MITPLTRVIATFPANGWQTIQYPDVIFDEDTKRWISVAQVAGVPFTAFTSQKKAKQVPGRLVVRRIPELNKKDIDQPELFDLYRFHAVFTTSGLDTVTADKTYRRHAAIEQVNADLQASTLAHPPSGKFTANAAWLVRAVMAFKLTIIASAGRGHRHDDPMTVGDCSGSYCSQCATTGSAPARAVEVVTAVDPAVRPRTLTTGSHCNLITQPSPLGCRGDNNSWNNQKKT